MDMRNTLTPKENVQATMQSLLLQGEFDGASDLLSAGGTLQNVAGQLREILYAQKAEGFSPLEARLLEIELEQINALLGPDLYSQKAAVENIRSTGSTETRFVESAPALTAEAA